MAVTTAVPVRVARRAWGWKWRIVALLVFVGLTALSLTLNAGRNRPAVSPLANPAIKPIVAQASVMPDQERKLAFRSAGLIATIAVKVGDTVKAGDTLASLDTADLELKVREAQANLALQKAQIAQSVEPPTAADLAAAQKALESAVAKQSQVEGRANPYDVKTAQEAVIAAQAMAANAQALLAKASAPPTPSDIAAAKASVRSAQAQLASAQQKLSDAKARPLRADVQAAELAVEQAKNMLWSQQLSRDSACGAFGPDSGHCKAAAASVAAQNTAVSSAQTSLDKARQPATLDELTANMQAVTSAQAAVTSAQAQLDHVAAGPTRADKDAARAQVDQALANVRSAQAKLDQTRSGSTDAEKQAAQSVVVDARAKLAKLTADASPATVDISRAKIEQAQVLLAEAEQALKEAVIAAPLAGQVTSIALKQGDIATSGATVVTVADLSTLRFVTNDLDEISAAKVHVGQPALVTIPALDKKTIIGTVTELDVEPAFTPSGDANYVARITLPEIPPGLRWGQTARVEFK